MFIRSGRSSRVSCARTFRCYARPFRVASPIVLVVTLTGESDARSLPSCKGLDGAIDVGGRGMNPKTLAIILIVCATWASAAWLLYAVAVESGAWSAEAGHAPAGQLVSSGASACELRCGRTTPRSESKATDAPDLCAIDDRIQRDVRALVTVADCGD